MAGTASKVYDLVYPSPIPLMELSSIAVAINLWHINLNQYRKIGVFETPFLDYSGDDVGYYDLKMKITLENILPNLPSIIHQIIEKYVKQLMYSTDTWLDNNYDWIFRYHRDNRHSILKDFDDIVCDYDGSIHYVRTAKRMMLCDRFSEDEKFKIACVYSFEGDIRRIGQHVESKVNLQEIDHIWSPSLYYWVCLLRNQLDTIPNAEYISYLAQPLIANIESTSPFEYFCNIGGWDSETKKIYYMCYKQPPQYLMFTRFVLPKLNEEQLTIFVNIEAAELLAFSNASDAIKLAVWMYIKDKMSEVDFSIMILLMMRNHATGGWNEFTNTYCEIWISASDKLKRSAIEHLLSEKHLLERDLDYDVNSHHVEPMDISFLLTVLLDMSSKEKSTFWCNNWMDLLFSKRIADVDRIMKLCFSNDNEISQFKKNTMANYDSIVKLQTLLLYNYFKQFSDVIDFISSEDEQASRDLKQECLQQHYLSSDSGICVSLTDLESFHELIDEAYGELATKFRNRFWSTPEVVSQLFHLVKLGYLEQVRKYVDSFSSRGSNVESFKERVANELREFLIGGGKWQFEAYDLREFLLWCVGSDGVTKMRQSISPVDVLRNMCMMDKEVNYYQESDAIEKVLLRNHPNLEDFLSWYFDTQDEINEFKARFANIFKILAIQPS